MMDRFDDLGAALQAVIAVQQHLGFHDGHKTLFLAYRGVAREHLGVGLDAQRRGIAFADHVDLAPFGKTRPLGLIGFQALRQAVESLGNLVSGGIGQRYLALVHLDSRHYPLAPRSFRKRSAVIGLLTQGFLEQDHAADERADARGRQQQGAINAPVLLGAFHLHGLEALGNGWQAFVGRQDALALLYQVSNRRLQLALCAHVWSPFSLDSRRHLPK